MSIHKQLYCSFLVLLMACGTPEKNEIPRNPKERIQEQGVTVEVYDYENFKPFTQQKDDQLYILNFWATWCVPCVAELPYFEELQEKYPELNVILVSLDFPDLIKENLIPFIIEHNLQSEVLVLDEPNGNRWIPEIDPNWSGAIPATLIYKNEKRVFYEQSFTFETLEEAISSF